MNKKELTKSTKSTPAQLRASKNYDKKHTKIYTVKVNLNTEKIINDKLQQVENVNGYIKDLILKDIKGTK